MRWKLILEYFGTNIYHIAGVNNILADTLIIFPSTPVNKYDPNIQKLQCFANYLFTISRAENNEDCLSINLLNVQIGQQTDLRKDISKLSTYISDWGFSYSKQALDNVNIICYDKYIYVPQNMCRGVLDWYHLYLNYQGGS